MSLFLLLLGACSIAELCMGQSTTPAPTSSCNHCFLAPGFTDVSSSHEEYLLFTAYSMTSAFAQNGLCVTVSGASTPLQTPYSVAQLSTNANPAQYQSGAATSFVQFLKVPDWGVCGENGSLAVHMTNTDTTAFFNVAVSTISGVASPTSLLSSSNTAALVATESQLSKPASNGLSTRDKAAIGLVVSVVVLALVLPGLILWYKYRKQHAAMTERRIQEKLEMETETEFPKGFGVGGPGEGY